MNKSKIRELFEEVLVEIEEAGSFNNVRKGLEETPRRIAEMYCEIFDGYSKDPNDYVKLFDEAHDEIIISKDIEFYSMCMHHVIPFFGTADIAYLPDKTILGISKLARIVDHFAHRLNVQEKMTTDIADFIMGCKLKPKGVMVILRATHLCEVMRGVKKKEPVMITSAVRGIFLEKPHVKKETLSLISRR